MSESYQAAMEIRDAIAGMSEFVERIDCENPTLRDRFLAALTGLLAERASATSIQAWDRVGKSTGKSHSELIAQSAYEFADAMMARRQATQHVPQT
jgi:hypothetical protein